MLQCGSFGSSAHVRAKAMNACSIIHLRKALTRSCTIEASLARFGASLFPLATATLLEGPSTCEHKLTTLLNSCHFGNGSANRSCRRRVHVWPDHTLTAVSHNASLSAPLETINSIFDNLSDMVFNDTASMSISLRRRHGREVVVCQELLTRVQSR